MIYLDQFKLPTHAQEDNIVNAQIGFSELGYATNVYPCHIFINKKLSSLDFSDITVLYGGNGSGKTTLLNLIAQKLQLKRIASFNKSSIFDLFVEKCDFKMGYDDEGDLYKVPNGSRIITSDDVFEYMLNARENNEDINSKVMQTRQKRIELKYAETVKLKGIEDYELLRDQLQARKYTGRKYVHMFNGKAVNLNSNGETALSFFNKKLENDTLILLDEPENSLSPKRQKELSNTIKSMARYCGCQFIIATHSPFMLAIENAKIYDLDSYPVNVKNWYELENVKEYFEFFEQHYHLFKK